MCAYLGDRGSGVELQTNAAEKHPGVFIPGTLTNAFGIYCTYT
jgi:hypothetical protein